MTRSRVLVILLLAVASPATSQTSLDPSLSISTYATGLARPLAMDWLGMDDVLVVEREVARVRRVQTGVLQPTSVYVHPVPTEDLLGIAINGEQPPRVFLTGK